ncbi:MAG: hypothetical protein D4R73_02170 [Deltaproteobacteria bacterium]|nr:MAG: hypothetical protein D4R73_02170 [Deltaproteobacteria bacterium]
MRHKKVKNLFIYFFCIMTLGGIFFCKQLFADELWASNIPHAIIVYPGLSDDGVTDTNLVGVAKQINPDTQVLITVTKEFVKIKRDSQSYKITNSYEAESLLRNLEKQGARNFIINIDMKIDFKNFPLKRNSESKWATAQGLMWTAAYKSVFKDSIVGSLSHSFGNTPAGDSIKNGAKIDYAIMASPGAKRSSLNKIAQNIPFSRLLVLTAEGDFHGPVHWDGPTKFDYIIIEKTKDHHKAMVDLNNIENPKIKYLTNIQNKDHGSSYGELLKGFVRQFNSIPSYFVSTDSKYPGKSMTEAQTLTETVHDKHKAVIVGKGPEVNLMYKNMVNKLGQGNVKRIDQYKDDKTLQLEARKFGADVILGVKGSKLPEAPDLGRADKRKRDDKYYKSNGGNPPPPPPPPPPGGVWIDPKPSKAGKGSSETKKKVLESRPSKDALFWEVK